MPWRRPVSSMRPTARATARWVLLESEGQGEEEEELGVRRSLDLREEGRLDGQGQVALHRQEVGDGPVVHPEPAAVAEGMTVGLLDRRAGRGADVREDPTGDRVAPAGCDRSRPARRCGRRPACPSRRTSRHRSRHRWWSPHPAVSVGSAPPASSQACREGHPDAPANRRTQAIDTWQHSLSASSPDRGTASSVHAGNRPRGSPVPNEVGPATRSSRRMIRGSFRSQAARGGGAPDVVTAGPPRIRRRLRRGHSDCRAARPTLRAAPRSAARSGRPRRWPPRPA